MSGSGKGKKMSQIDRLRDIHRRHLNVSRNNPRMLHSKHIEAGSIKIEINTLSKTKSNPFYRSLFKDQPDKKIDLGRYRDMNAKKTSDQQTLKNEPAPGGKEQREHGRLPLFAKLKLLTRREDTNSESPVLKIEANCIDISASGIGASCKECPVVIGEMVEINLDPEKNIKAICSVTHISYDENFTNPYQIGLRFQKLNKNFINYLKEIIKEGA